jgi:gliding motility-associated-like protein
MKKYLNIRLIIVKNSILRYKITKKDAEVLLFSLILHKYSHINMKIGRIIAFWATILLSTGAYATIKLQAVYYDKSGTEITAEEDFQEDAPLHVRLLSNPSDLDAGSQIEWHIRNTTTGSSITRYDENVELDLVDAGVTVINLQVRLDDIIMEEKTLKITISESHLEMPNAFSPNGDGINDKYQAKSNSKSIVEFHAYIFNRYGQKIYEWTDWNNRDGGWDGTSHGHPVKDGVYYVYVKARGADGIEYNIRRDVNLLRNFNTLENTNP